VQRCLTHVANCIDIRTCRHEDFRPGDIVPPSHYVERRIVVGAPTVDRDGSFTQFGRKKYVGHRRKNFVKRSFPVHSYQLMLLNFRTTHSSVNSKTTSPHIGHHVQSSVSFRWLNDTFCGCT
jgi:hypothetical protein